MKLTSRQLISLAMVHHGEYHAIKKALDSKKYVEEKFCDHAITILDDLYPKELRELDQPPYVLFYKGNIQWLEHNNRIAIIGSRHPSKYGIDMTRNLVDEVDRGVVVVSGLAKGIDGLAHQCALHKNKCIGVLGCGIDRVYPYENLELFQKLSKHHLLLSEYPAKTPGLKHHFVARNRIIAALSNHVFVMAATQKSGTLITVDFALALNKEISVLPYTIDDESGVGCNNLIASGAQMLTNVQELFIIKKD